MSKHTPGPWKVVERGIPWAYGGKIGIHTERRIFTVWDHPQLKAPRPVVNLSTGIGPDDSRVSMMVSISEADARLIAAAPELLEALEIAYYRLEDMLKGDDGQAWKEAEKSLFKIHKAIAKAKGEV